MTLSRTRCAATAGMVMAVALQTAPAGAQPTGTMLSTPLIDLQAVVAEGFHPSKMDVGPDGKIYFNNSVNNTTYRVDDLGNLEAVASYGGDCPFGVGPGFLLGLQFDSQGNLYAVNCTGLWKVPAADIPAGPNNQVAFDASHNLLFRIQDPSVPQGLGIVGNDAYIADMVGGRIYKVDLTNGQAGSGAAADGVWADYRDDYPIVGKPDSNNFLTGFPLCREGGNLCAFGAVEPMPGPKGKWLYFTNHEENGIYRIRIKNNGSAGTAQKLDDVPPFALNGAYLDPVLKIILAGSPFTDFPVGFNGALPAGKIFVLDKLNPGGNITEFADMSLADGPAVPVDAVSGRDVGTGHPDLVYVLDGSFDTLMWPPSGMMPSPGRTGHAAIRVIQYNP